MNKGNQFYTTISQETLQKIVYLYVNNELTHNEIAEKVNVSPKTIFLHLKNMSIPAKRGRRYRYKQLEIKKAKIFAKTKTVKEIEQLVFLSRKTIEKHTKNIREAKRFEIRSFWLRFLSNRDFCNNCNESYLSLTR